MSAAGAAAGAAAAAAVARATKASGVIVRVEPEDFRAILARTAEPLVVHASGGVLRTMHQYLTSYKGIAFFTRSRTRLELSRSAELVEAESIWVP